MVIKSEATILNVLSTKTTWYFHFAESIAFTASAVAEQVAIISCVTESTSTFVSVVMKGLDAFTVILTWSRWAWVDSYVDRKQKVSYL